MAAAIGQLALIIALLGSCTWFMPSSPPTGGELTASIRATPAQGTAPLDVVFDASASCDPVGEGLACTWLFGDGSTGAGSKVAHTYGAGGTYQVLLIARDGAGASATASGTIEVAAQPVQIEDHTSETDAAGVATLTVGGEALTITVILPGTTPGSTSKQGSGESAGLGVRVYALGEMLGVFIYDDQERYEPAIAVLESGAAADSSMAAAKAKLTRVIQLSLMQGRDGISVVTRSTFTDAMQALGYNASTRRFPFSFSTSEETVDGALGFGLLRPALRLDPDASPEGTCTPYALYIRQPIAGELGLATGGDGVAVVGYGPEFLTGLAHLLTPMWRKAASVTFSVGTSGAPVPGSAVLESYSTATSLTMLVETGSGLTQHFQCSASGHVLEYVQWGFGDGRDGQGQNIEHTYDRPGAYEVAVTAYGSYGTQFHGSVHVDIPYACTANQYDRQKAVQYAADWWDKFNEPKYEDYSDPNGDCANFVSQCLLAGGVDLSRQGKALAWGVGGTIPSCNSMDAYFRECLKLGDEGADRQLLIIHLHAGETSTPPAWFAPGDVAIVHDNEAMGGRNHALVAIRRNSADEIVFASHTPALGAEDGKGIAPTMEEFLAKPGYDRDHVTYYHIPNCLAYANPPAPTLLDAPQLQSPVSGASNQPLTLTLQWTRVAEANDYWVLVATDRATLPTNVNAAGCTDCLYKNYTKQTEFEVTLKEGTTYYWCIQACDLSATPTQQGNYSEIRSFTTLPGDCTYSLTDYEEPFTSSGGSGSFRVETQAGCAWTASSDSMWLTFTASGSPGSGAVNYSVQAYSGTTLRTGRITVRDKTFTVSQTGTSPCSYTLSSYVQNYTDSGSHSASFNVTAGSSCTWSPVVSMGASSWLTAVASVSAGNGRVDYTITANDTSVVRTGYIYVQDKTFTITQAAKPPVVKELDHLVVNGPSIVNEDTVTSFTCTAYFNDTSTLDVTALATWTEDSPYTSVSGGSLTVASLSGDSSCAVRASYTYNGINKWAFKAVALKDVVTVLDRIEVTGPTVVNENSWGDYACMAYFSNGDALSVTGAATWTCTPGSSWGTHPTTVTIAAGRLTVGALDSDDDWIVTASYGSGSSTKYDGFAVHLHDTTPPPPPPTPCQFLVPTQAPRVAGAGGQGWVCVRNAAGCTWTASTSSSWIHITSGADYSGDSDVAYTVDSNPGTERTGTITAAGVVCTITQSQGPTVPPVARITMTAQGKIAHEGDTLSLTMYGGSLVRVNLSAAASSSDKAAPDASWSIDGGLGGFMSEIYWDFTTLGSHTIRLYVLNADGYTSASADATVLITAP
jgi:hypothetical protein